MIVTKEHLEAKLADYTRQRDQIAANLNALAGAIEALKALINECGQPADCEPAQSANV